MIVEVVREKSIGYAVPSKIYVDGAFFSYGLENDNYKIPAGIYDAYGMTSPKFGTNKLYITVPGRSSILFHGGNDADDTKGCVLVGQNRDGDRISGDVSDELFNVVDRAYRSGEAVAVKITGGITGAAIFLGVAGIVALIYLLR